MVIGLSANGDMSDVRVQDSRVERHSAAVNADLRAVAAEIGGGNIGKQVVVGENSDIEIEADKHLVEITEIVQMISFRIRHGMEEMVGMVRDADTIFVIQAGIIRSRGGRG